MAFLKIKGAGSQWSCLRIGDVHVYLLQFVTILCVLNTLQFVHVETGQTPGESCSNQGDYSPRH